MATYGTFVDEVPFTAAEANDFLTWIPYDASTSVTQNNSTVTNANYNAKYALVNKLVYYYLRFAVNSLASAGELLVGLPVTASSGAARVSGSGFVRDASTTDLIRVACVRTSTTKFALMTDSGTSLSAYLGTNPTLTLTNSDEIFVSIVYEAA
jgi:hypothetical protein